MPKVVEGLLRALAVLAVTILASYAVLAAITHVLRAIDILDTASMEVTGLPARRTTVSERAEAVLSPLAVVAAIAPIGVLVAYFVHRPRR